MTPISRSRLLIILLLVVILMFVGVLIYQQVQSEDGFIKKNGNTLHKSVKLPVRVGKIAVSNTDGLDRPLGVAVSEEGQVLVADSGRNRVVVFNTRGKIIRKFGQLAPDQSGFNYPVAVVVNDENGLAYVADFNNNRIQVFNWKSGDYSYSLPKAGDKEKIGEIQPVALALDMKGNLYASDVTKQRIIVFDPAGKFLYQFGEPGDSEGQLQFANGIAVDDNNELIYVADTNNGRIQVFSIQGKFVRSIAHMGDKQMLVTPRGIALDKDKRVLYIADTITQKVFVYNLVKDKAAFLTKTKAGSGELNFPNGIALDKEGKLYVTERGSNQIGIYAYSD